MPKKTELPGGDEQWAHFRFSVIGPLLAAPPETGELRARLKDLASKRWRHPVSGEWASFGASTIERWYYQAVHNPADPVSALSRKIREDLGTHPSMPVRLRNALHKQYREHTRWSYQLHYENLMVLADENPELKPVPSYESVRRYMKAHGLRKRRRRGKGCTAGVVAAEKRFDNLEIRSYESEYVNALWHLDYHSGSLKVLLPDGEWSSVHLFGVMDDHSRLCCHVQWYVAETAQNLIHGLSQAFEKRGLPRALMTDNGGAMTAAETVQGLLRLSITHEATLPYSPYQNGKQESFWGQIEGRLLPMLENCRDLSLANLNEATMAWVELDYNRKSHSEIGGMPLSRFIHHKDVGRQSPPSEELREAFTAKLSRSQRQSDGTISLDAVRFEIPSRYRLLKRVIIRYASWDLSSVYLADERTGKLLCRLYPQDKQKNADGLRRHKPAIVEGVTPTEEDLRADTMAPLLRKLIAEYAATGLPPAYLPKDEINHKKEDDNDE